MPFTTSYKRGDVVLVPFPFTDLTGIKQRPAVVISSDAFNDVREDVLIAAITSQVPGGLKPDEFLLPAAGLSAGGLVKPSMVKLLKLVSLHQRLIVKRIGHLPETTTENIIEQIRKLL